jgi:opacity protein-like surface antigen
MRLARRFTAPLALLALCAQARPAAAQGGLIGIDGMSATVLQEGQSSFSGLGFRMRLTSVQLVPGIDFLPSFEYWRNRSTVQPFGIETGRRDATLAVDARYTFRRDTWSPYVGAGLGMHFLSSEVHAPSLGVVRERDSVVKGGLAALGGVTFPLTSRVHNFLELKYHHVTEYRQLKINWGLSYDFR